MLTRLQEKRRKAGKSIFAQKIDKRVPSSSIRPPILRTITPHTSSDRTKGYSSGTTSLNQQWMYPSLLQAVIKVKSLGKHGWTRYTRLLVLDQDTIFLPKYHSVSHAVHGTKLLVF